MASKADEDASISSESSAIPLLCAPWLFVSQIHNFLSANKPIKHAHFALVEGWLDEYYYTSIVDHIQSNNYEKIITTGGKLPSAFTMFTNGTLIFDIHNLTESQNQQGVQKITINCTGTPVHQQYPFVTLCANKVLLAEFFAVKPNHDYILWIPDSLGPITEFSINFSNDITSGLHDRNLTLNSIHFDGQNIPIRQKGIMIDNGPRDGQYQYSVAAKNYATQACQLLARYKINQDKVVAIPAFENNNRTLGHALAVREWIQSNAPNIKSINIITKGTHARRSYMIYKNILPKNIEIGVISYPPFSYNPNRWWRSHLGRYTVLYETVGLLYYSLVLLFT